MEVPGCGRNIDQQKARMAAVTEDEATPGQAALLAADGRLEEDETRQGLTAVRLATDALDVRRHPSFGFV